MDGDLCRFQRDGDTGLKQGQLAFILFFPFPAELQFMFGRVGKPAVEGGIRDYEHVLNDVLIYIQLCETMLFMFQHDVLYPYHLDQCISVCIRHNQNELTLTTN